MHNAGMIYGYARVSTDAQDLSNQVAQLKAADCATIYREKISGATVERPRLKKLMVKFGRKPSLTPHQQQEARKRIDAGETQRSVARSYNVSEATISRLAA
jgi:DNA invertase Pin-like site-specific DNA recombinase